MLLHSPRWMGRVLPTSASTKHFINQELPQCFVSRTSEANRNQLCPTYRQAPATSYLMTAFRVLLDDYDLDFMCSFTFKELLKFDLNLRSILENWGEFF